MEAGPLLLLFIRVAYKAELQPGFLPLLVHDDVVLGQSDWILKNEHEAFGLLADLMILAIVYSQLFGSFEYFKLGQVVDLTRYLPHTGALLATNITEVVVLPIVHIQLLIVIEVLLRAEPTDTVRLLYVFLQGCILIECLLE